MSLETNGEDDEDCLFLERVLDKLYDFGSAPKKKLKSQKKKKRKRCDEEEEEALHAVNDVSCDSEDSRTENLSAYHQQQPSQTYHTGPTIQQENQVEVVTFQDPRKKLKTKQNAAPRSTPKPQITEKQQSDQQEKLTLEKARLEVHRFGITGYKKEQQRVFEQDRAVMLGARPPKKEYVNYKVLQRQIKEKKQTAKDEAQQEKKKKKKKQSNQSRDKKKPSSGSGGGPSGQLGRFKNGMLILSSKEIQKIKKHK